MSSLRTAGVWDVKDWADWSDWCWFLFHLWCFEHWQLAISGVRDEADWADWCWFRFHLLSQGREGGCFINVGHGKFPFFEMHPESFMLYNKKVVCCITGKQSWNAAGWHVKNLRIRLFWNSLLQILHILPITGAAHFCGIFGLGFEIISTFPQVRQQAGRGGHE